MYPETLNISPETYYSSLFGVLYKVFPDKNKIIFNTFINYTDLTVTSKGEVLKTRFKRDNLYLQEVVTRISSLTEIEELHLEHIVLKDFIKAKNRTFMEIKKFLEFTEHE